MSPKNTSGTPAQQLKHFLSKYDTNIATTALRAAARLRKLIPPSTEMVYDNYNALVIAFGPTEKSSDAVLSLALYPRYVTLFFSQGAVLPDPHKRLGGSGNVVKQLKLESEKTLDDPQIIELINLALHRAKTPFRANGVRTLVIKSVSRKQRSRKPVKSKQ